jgi:intracellular sulfur oxidation DsrE/DsrF family protein
MSTTVIVVTKPGLGHTSAGDEAFGVEMLDSFFHTLERASARPAAICFYTAGVTLLKADSPVLMGLLLLQRMGVRIVACKSCLSHYQMGTELPVGEIGTMVDIVQLINSADKVVTV